MSDYTLKVKKREILGNRVKVLRREGQVPAVVYGAKKENISLQVQGKEFLDLYKQAGKTNIVYLDIDNKIKTPSIVHKLDLDPVTNILLHIDFLRVKLDEKVKVNIPVIIQGESPVVKSGEAVLSRPNTEVEVECLPNKIPENVIVDISKLETVHDTITAGDIKIQDDFEFTDPSVVLVSVVAPTAEVEEEITTSVEDAGGDIENENKTEEESAKTE